MKIIALTIGDPGGIGPEVAVRAAAALGTSDILPVIIGDRAVIEEAVSLCDPVLSVREVGDMEDLRLIPETLWYSDVQSGEAFVRRKADGGNGRACAAYIRKAVSLALAKKIEAVVTAPISKKALNLGGQSWPGHTEMLAELTGTSDYAMMLVGGPLRVILVTIHVPLAEVPRLVVKERVLRTIRLAHRACDMLGIDEPVIAVAGLNPHAGETGLLGKEEIKEIVPAVESARAEGITVLGPFPPDVVFRKAYRREVDIVVCMYHDQGLIPLKMIAFEKGVNVTVGLPIIRTSPDHGTAYDIAWKGIADPSSMIEAVLLASRMRIRQGGQ